MSGEILWMRKVVEKTVVLIKDNEYKDDKICHTPKDTLVFTHSLNAACHVFMSLINNAKKNKQLKEEENNGTR